MPPSSTALSDLHEVSSASKERSSQNRMKRLSGAPRRCASRCGSDWMSSRWISTSLSPTTSPCTALTSELLPMPRTPQSSALFAGSPRANRAVLASSVSRAASMPLSSASGTRLTVLTVRRLCVSACQTKASPAAKSGRSGSRGPRRSWRGRSARKGRKGVPESSFGAVAKARAAAIVPPPSRVNCPSRDDQGASPGEGGHP